MAKRVTALLSVLAAASAITILGPAGPAFAGTCGQTFQPTVNGGEAAWSLQCSGGTIRIDGWVKDTKADGKCAFVKAFGGNGGAMNPHAKACPKGKKTDFSWSTSGTVINAYLYVA